MISILAIILVVLICFALSILLPVLAWVFLIGVIVCAVIGLIKIIYEIFKD